MILVEILPNFQSWKDKALELVSQDILPQDILWQDGSQTGFFLGEAWNGGERKEFKLDRDFVSEAPYVACYREASTWDLLYRLLFRLTHGEARLMNDPLDPDVLQFKSRLKSVTRDLHKMKAFVRFKKTVMEEEEWFVAWHRPDHRIIREAASFFLERFKGMNWTIMTEDESAHWNGEKLWFSEGVKAQSLPRDDQDDLWKAYYGAVFNPARIKINAMKKELPVRYWKSLPETESIDSLIAAAPERLKQFYQDQKAAPQLEIHDLTSLFENIQRCSLCDICSKASGPVQGEGPPKAKLMLVGEQPGDEEDQKGRPFIGPAGQLLDRALDQVKLNRREIYITNAVKGFKWLPQEHRRWHRSADGSEIAACRPWLKKEIELVKPQVLVCLGRSAAQSVLGKMVKLEDVRGRFFSTSLCSQTIILPHPSSILRIQDKTAQHVAYLRFVSELQMVQDSIA